MLNLRKRWELFFGHSLSLETDALFYAKKNKEKKSFGNTVSLRRALPP